MKKQKVVICDLDHTYLMTHPYVPYDKLTDICWIDYHSKAKITYFPSIANKIQKYYDNGVVVVFLTAREHTEEFEAITRKNIEGKFKGEYRLIMKLDVTEPDAVFKYKTISRLKIYSEILEFLDDKECVCNEVRKLNIPVTHVVHKIPEKEKDMSRMQAELEKMRIQEKIDLCCEVLSMNESLLIATLGCSHVSPKLEKRLDLLSDLINHIKDEYEWYDDLIKEYILDSRIEFDDGEDCSIFAYICANENIDEIIEHLREFNSEIDKELEVSPLAFLSTTLEMTEDQLLEKLTTKHYLIEQQIQRLIEIIDYLSKNEHQDIDYIRKKIFQRFEIPMYTLDQKEVAGYAGYESVLELLGTHFTVDRIIEEIQFNEGIEKCAEKMGISLDKLKENLNWSNGVARYPLEQLIILVDKLEERKCTPNSIYNTIFKKSLITVTKMPEGNINTSIYNPRHKHEFLSVLKALLDNMSAGDILKAISTEETIPSSEIHSTTEETLPAPEVTISVKDEINHPPHYNQSDIEPIDAIEAWNLPYHLGNVIKYLARHEHKGSPLKDLKKARWYLDRYISLIDEDE